MADPYAETRALLDERPAIEDTLADVLAVDETGPWAFDDVDADSGIFGELVARGIVERVDDAESAGDYRLADPDAVRAGLEGKTDPAGGRDQESGVSAELGSLLVGRFTTLTERIHRDLVASLLAAFTLLFVMRSVTIRRVFRDERIILPGNDPYHYLYWVERLAAADVDRLDAEGIADVLGGRATGEPLVYTIGWWATELFGSGVDDAVRVVAWIPIVCALIVGAGVYAIAIWTTDDERIAVVSVVVLALLPGHALYSGIGFFDHHAIDYVWLTLSIAGVLWLARDSERYGPEHQYRHLTSPGTWAVVVGLGIIFSAMVHTWNGSPILLVGLAVYATIRATADLRAGWNPLVAATPIVSALGIGFVFAYALHTRAGWQEPVVIYSLALVAVGVVAVTGMASLLGRLDVHPGVHLGGAAASVVPLWLGFRNVRPNEAARLADRAVDSLLGRESAAETRSLFAADFGVIFGPIDHFGWFLFVALPVLGWVTWRCVNTHEPRWLVIVGYAYALIGFAMIQIRFAGEAAPVVAVLSGVGVVYLLAVVDLTDRPVPFGRERTRVRIAIRPASGSWGPAGYVIGTLLLVSSLSLFMVPAVLDTVAASNEEAAAIEWIAADAAEHDDDFVLNRWGRSRMFNYAVNGESDRYGYAWSNFEPFIQDHDPDAHADSFEGTVGYVVLHEIDAAFPPETAYAQLFEERGSASDAADGSGRFQYVYTTPGEEIRVFRPVAGTTITGEAPAGETVTVRTDVEVDASGESFTYERRTTAEDGDFRVTVAHGGEYEVEFESESESDMTRTVNVSAESIRDGGVYET